MGRQGFDLDHFRTFTNLLKIHIRTDCLNLYSFNLLAEIGFTQQINSPPCSEYEGMLLLKPKLSAVTGHGPLLILELGFQV